MKQITPITYVVALLIAVLYSFIAYGIDRSQFEWLLISYICIAVLTYWLFQKNSENKSFLLGITLVFRVVLLWGLPTLSQDFYRFIWDGRMLAQGISPYLYLPKDLITLSSFKLSQSQILFEGMGGLSAQHFSNYPPLNQLCFYIAGTGSPTSIIGAVTIFRILIICADFGIYHFGTKLLRHFKKDTNRIFYYLLNPLVVLELTGNLHFEGVMLFFLVWGLYLLSQTRWVLSSVLIGCSIAIKLLPLLLLPLVYQRLGLRKTIWFGAMAIGVNILFFAPFLTSDLIQKYSQTIGLWFTNFEFNASIYYVVRYLGYQVTGYNIIQTVGKFTPLVVLGMVLAFTFLRKNKTDQQLITTMLLTLTMYLFLSTTVHPWYLISLVVLSVFTHYNFAFLWSIVVILSYYAYSNFDFEEHLGLVALEYGLVIVYLVVEIVKKNKLDFALK